MVSRPGPENAPSFDIFGHNPQRRWRHENHHSHNDSGVAGDIWRRDLGPDSDPPGASGDRDQLKIVWGDDQHAFSRSIPAVHQRAGRIRGVPDRFTGFGIRDLLIPRCYDLHRAGRRVR